MIMCLFLVLLGPCPQILGARLVSHQRVLMVEIFLIVKMVCFKPSTCCTTT